MAQSMKSKPIPRDNRTKDEKTKQDRDVLGRIGARDQSQDGNTR
jgi:hypothetical protein